ncbi:MAG: HAMP domain-containing histidine kinase [Muribaculum sp.]|nr:HAMP domain-containing histidine kinase [Muribaculum sp.]
MKKVVLLLAVLLMASLVTMNAEQTSVEQILAQAKAASDAKNYNLAAGKYIQAYNEYIKAKDYEQAARSGMRAANAYAKEKNYDGAMQLLNRIDKNLTDLERASGKPMYAPHFQVERGRLNLYLIVKNTGGANASIKKLEQLSDSAKSVSVENDLLYSKAKYHYALGHPEEGDVYTSQLIRKFDSEKDYRKAKEDYQMLIDGAVAGNNARQLDQTYGSYIQWSDSIDALTSDSKVASVKKKYDQSLKTIADREETIKSKSGLVVALGILLAVSVGVMIFLCVALWRFIARNRKMHRAVDDANERNAQKTMLIRNISSQMEPALAALDQNHPAVKGMRRFTDHARELSELESSLDERYPLDDVNIQSFCDEMVDQIRPMLKSGVSVVVNASKSVAKLNKEETEKVVVQLLKYAAEQTPEGGKITLDYKKRGAKLQQFIVTDTGAGIPEDMRENIFKPFASGADLMKDDGLSLPIASLRAVKLDGTLKLDTSYRHGTRFTLDIHS